MVSPPFKATVLVVEDDPGLRAFYLSALRIAGYNVITAQDGVDALRRIETEIPALVVLDIGLPRLGGLDVQAELKSHAETMHIPIMVVSGTETRDLNPNDFACVMRKPVTAEQLIEAIERCLRERRR